MSRWSRYILFVGFLLGFLFGVWMLHVALEDNPHEIYTDNPLYLVPIFYGWLATVSYFFVLAAAGFELCRSLLGNAVAVTKSVNLLHVGILLGVPSILVSHHYEWYHPGDVFFLVTGSASIVAFPFALAAGIIEIRKMLADRKKTAG